MFKFFLSDDKYKQKWEQVASFESQGLPQSALKVVEEIYLMAKEEKNTNQLIKALIHRMKYKNDIEDGGFVKIILDLENEIKSAELPAKAIMQSILAEMYSMYYQNNRWKFYNRSETVDFKSDSIDTWDLNTLADHIIKLYNESLAPIELLQQTAIDDYTTILVVGSKPKDFRPTLYDFLANRAVSYFISNELSITRPADQFTLNDEVYFAHSERFIAAKITSHDTLSLQYHAIRILQQITAFHLERSNKPALIDAELTRLRIVNSASANSEKDTLYLQALKHLQQQALGISILTSVNYEIAQFYNSRATRYNREDPATAQYKWDKKKAIELCDQAIAQFPDSEGASQCKALRELILDTELSFVVENYIPTTTKWAAAITYKNIETLYLRVASIDPKKVENLRDKYYGRKYIENRDQLYYDELKKASKELIFKTIVPPVDNDYNTHAVEEIVNGLPLGMYLVIVANNKKLDYQKNLTSYNFFRVSNFSYTKSELYQGKSEYHVLNRNSGLPINNVKVTARLRYYDYGAHKDRDITKQYTTDADGLFVVESPVQDRWVDIGLKLEKDSDFYESTSENIHFKSYNETTTVTTKLFTDRAIYRPGQTVYFKGIVISKTAYNKAEVVKDRTDIVILYDVNYQKVAELEVKTNEYGSFGGTFILPTGLLNGQMQIYTGSGAKYISVEEYKRPAFEVKIPPVEGNFVLNDSVKVKGTAISYAGAPLTGAAVKFRVTRKPEWRGWWYYSFDTNPTEIANGIITTDEKGEFSVTFKALPDPTKLKDDKMVYNYSVIADVTDINGETQSTSNSLTVGYVALQASLDIQGDIDKQSVDNAFDITTENLNGQFVATSGKVVIQKLMMPKEALRSRFWTKPDKSLYLENEWNTLYPGNEFANEYDYTKAKPEKQVFDADFNTEKSKELVLTGLDSWETGAYMAEITCKDAFGNNITNKHFFTVYAVTDKKLPYEKPAWFIPVATRVEPGENAKILVGTGYNGVKMLYTIEHNYRVVAKQWIELNDEQKLIEIPVTEDYRGNFAVHFSFIKNNRFYQYDATITVPYTNKQLTVEFSSYRDKLYPGQDEQWRLTLKGPKAERVAAEMMATLYDASLDVFRKNYWTFDVFGFYYSNIGWSSPCFSTNGSELLKVGFSRYYPPSYYYTSLNWFGFGYYSSRYLYGDIQTKSAVGGVMERSKSRNGKKYAEAPVVAMSVKREAAVGDVEEDAMYDKISDDRDEETNLPVADSAPPEPEPSQFEEVKIRTNFNETAFFYPQLETNDEGEVVVSFKVPESLTRWRMMGLAHTQDLQSAYCENTLVTQKDLMLAPNAPRFFREGDIIEFPVKISNISDKDLSGQVCLELFDALTMTPVKDIKKLDVLNFNVPSKQNTSVSWTFQIPEGLSAITYRVVAKSGSFSDGEEKPIPVLTNRMLVTESLPLYVNGKQTKEFEFTKLINSGASKTLRHESLTLEFSSNPAWYAVQALPYLMEYPYECSEQTFSRLYANSLASHIANSSPKIKQVFDSWRDLPDSKALLSNLEKNQELKYVLLEETPWVLNSQNETERKKRIGLLFDLNNMAAQLESAVKKLSQSQKGSGGWPWFEGMDESRYITQHIVAGIGHLHKLKVDEVIKHEKINRMMDKAIPYLDNQIDEEYDYLKRYYKGKELDENHLSDMAIHYLYTRSFFMDKPIPSGSKEAVDYFKKQAQTYWLNNRKYSQGMMALALHRMGDTETPKKIVASIKEFAQHSEELGMFWKDNSGGWYWYEAPIETQALFIELFDEVTNDEFSVNEMKVWLLKQKQTQDWKTTKATAEAIYALLLRGGNWLESDKLVEIQVGNIKVDPKQMPDVKVEAGTGYFKTKWTADQIKPNMGKVKLTKTTDGIAWGALYWQYFEQLDKITPHETPLKLNKKLFIEKLTPRGPVIEPLDEKHPLNVGDKIIVRIELRVDRAMEYVHMKDMRASSFEPINVISRYKYQDGLGYYESTKDAAVNFFMGYLPKGSYVFEYPLRVAHRGDFSNGITTIQCMYAPEFTSHSEGIRVKVE